MERAGIVAKAMVDSRPSYRLTPAGEELRPVLSAIGTWGQRWARDICKQDLVWAMHRRLDTASMPKGRIVIQIVFTDVPAHRRYFWLVHSGGTVDVCLKSPGFDTDIAVSTRVRVLAQVWRGLRPLEAAPRGGDIRLAGHAALVRAFPQWLMLSVYAHVERAGDQHL